MQGVYILLKASTCALGSYIPSLFCIEISVFAGKRDSESAHMIGQKGGGAFDLVTAESPVHSLVSVVTHQSQLVLAGTAPTR